MSAIYYIGHYDLKDEPRSVSPAAVTMMDYVSEVIQREGFQCNILSCASDVVSHIEKKVILNDGRKVVFKPCFGKVAKTNFPKWLHYAYKRKKSLFQFFDHHINDGDTVILYHSLVYIDAIKKLISRKKIHLIIQVCEIYSDVINDNRQKQRELDFFKLADGFIFSTAHLGNLINIDNKPSCVCLGTYKIEHSYSAAFLTNDCINVVYAGTLDPRKGGATAAATAAAFLPKDYTVHVLGFGSQEEIDHICSIIEEANAQGNGKAIFEGVKRGSEFNHFVQNCRIGLSTQEPTAKFNATSFPSKVLMYMANGLNVVSIDIPAIRQSAVSPAITFYSKQEPDKIAKAVVEAVYNPKSTTEILKRLDKEFGEKLAFLLNYEV